MPIDGKNGLTAKRLGECLRYDPETGLFIWLVARSAWRKAGSEAGEIKPSGYSLIGIDGTRYRAHRLAWLYMTGEWPQHQIDHINGNRADNRWCNLRQATQKQNSANMRCRDSNIIGVKGVSLYRGLTCVRYRAHITVDRKIRYLGSFRTLEDAKDAYEKAAQQHFGDYARAA